LFYSKKSPLKGQPPFALSSRGVYAISTQKAQPQRGFFISFSGYDSSMPSQNSREKKHNTQLSYDLGSLRPNWLVENESRLLVSVFFVWFFSSPAYQLYRRCLSQRRSS